MATMTRPGLAEPDGVEVIPPTRRRSIADCSGNGGDRNGSPARRREACSRAAPPLNRDHRPPLPSASAAPMPHEVEDLSAGTEPEHPRRLRRQQHDVVAGDAIGLHEIAPSEILDPRDVLWDRGCCGSCCGTMGPQKPPKIYTVAVLRFYKGEGVRRDT